MSDLPSVESLEREKADLIRRYLEIQDILDDYNEQMYKVCCEIETLNLRIGQARSEAKSKASLKPAARPNGANGDP